MIVPPDKVDEVARQYLKAPDMEDFDRLPQAVQERIYILEIEQEFEIAEIAVRVQLEITPEDFCIAGRDTPGFPWKECLRDARYALSDYQCRLRELNHNNLDGIILERMYRIDQSLK